MEEESLLYVLCSVILFQIISPANGFEEAGKIHFTNSWAVHIENGSDVIASEIAEKHGFHNFGQIGSLPGYYQFVHREIKKRRKRREVSKTATLLLEDKIQWVEQQHVLDRDKRSIIPDYIDVIHPNGYSIQDPLYSDQWYLNNIGQSSGPIGLDINVLPVWARGIAGKGVVVTILDDGLDHTHPDLKTNYDPKASYDFNDYDEDPMPRSSDPNNCHGTKCAGEVSAEAGNGVCGVGVAFNSSVGGIRMLDGNVTDTIEGSALSYHKDYIDIYSCAWGPKDDGKRFGRPGTLASKALELGAKEGRNGLGSIFVWATGNGGLTDDDCNCDGYTTSVFTISIGAISDHGLSTYYTESCASTLAVTYSGGSHREKKENKIVTTTLNHKCTDEFKGTSAAAPIAAGMIALVLETNPNVTWRDVQHLIVETSVMSSPLDEGWRRNGAGKWFNQKFGFGRMDAAAMVEKAATWSNVQEQRNCWSDKSEGPWTIPSSGTVLVAMNTTACGETTSNIRAIEHVQVVLSLNHRRRGHVSIELISPSGTRTQLLKTRRNDRSTKGLKDWVFMSVHFWGEDPKGTWTLAVTDNNHNDREHHVETTKYGDMEDATGALQDLIEDKEENIEHEKIVEDDELFKSAEEFENQIFKDDTYRRGKDKSKEKEKEKEEKEKEKEKELDVIDGNDNVAEEINKVILDKYVAKEKKLEETNEEGKVEENEEERSEEEGSHKVNKNSRSSKAKKNPGKATKSSDKTISSTKSKANKKTKAKKKLTVEEDAEKEIVEELLKDSTPHFQSAITSNTSKAVALPSLPSTATLALPGSSPSSSNPFAPLQNVSKQLASSPHQPQQIQPQYSPPSQTPTSVSASSPLQPSPQSLSPSIISPPQLSTLSPPPSSFPQSSLPSSSFSNPPQSSSSLSSSLPQSTSQSAFSVSPPSFSSSSSSPVSSSYSSSSSSPASSTSPPSSSSSSSSTPPSSSSSSSVQATVPQHAVPATITINVGRSNTTVQTNEAGAIGMVSNHSSEENSTLEFVLRNVLTEVFANFKQEDQGYKLLANRIEGLEIALQEGKNKSHNSRGEGAQRYSTALLNALKNGKPIDKIQKVLNVLEDSRQNNASRHNTNSSFAKNTEVVTDVLKVLKDIMSTKKDDLKDDRELKLYKKRISKLLQTSSNGTRQLTEKLFNDIEPIGDGKEDSTTSSHVMNDALTLISHVFQRNKPQQNIQPIKISKDFRISLKTPSLSRTHYDDKDQPNPFRMVQSERNDYDPLSDILLHGDFVKNILAKDKGKSSDKDHSSSSGKEEGTVDDSRAGREPYEKVGMAEENGQHIFSNPGNGNELGMNQYQENNEESRDNARHREEKGENKISNHDSTEHFRKVEVDDIHYDKDKQSWHKEKEAEEKEPPRKYDTLDHNDRNYNDHGKDHDKDDIRHEGELKRFEDHNTEDKADREASKNKDSPKRCELSTPGCDHRADFMKGHEEEGQNEKEHEGFSERESARKYDDVKTPPPEQKLESHGQERQSEGESTRMLGSENKDLNLDNQSDTEEHHRYLVEHDRNTQNEHAADRKGTEEDSSDFTIAIMKDGKKIGERKVDKLQATRYLDKPKIATTFFPDVPKAKLVSSFYPISPAPSFMRESELKSEATESEGVFLKSALFPSSVPLSSDSPKTQANPSKTEDGDKPSNIVEYNKISRKPPVPLDEYQHPSKDLDFDVTKFASEENRFNEHTLDHPEKLESSEASTGATITPEDKPNIEKDPETAEVLNTRKTPPSLPLNPNLPMEKPEKELHGEIEDIPKNDLSLNDAFSENTKRKDNSVQKNEQNMMEKHSGIKTNGSNKNNSKWAKRGKEKHRDKDDGEEEYEHFMHFDGPMPFMQIPDPTQFAPGEVQADENENFLHPSFGAFNPNRIPTIVNLPVHTSFFDNHDIPEFEVDNTENAEEYEAMKRSDIPELRRSPPQLFDDEIYVGKGEVVTDKPERTRRSSEEDYDERNDDGQSMSIPEKMVQRSQRGIDNEDKEVSDEKYRYSEMESEFSFSGSKRSFIQEETEDDAGDNDGGRGPHVVKRSAVLSEIPLSKKLYSHARPHSHTKRGWVRIKTKGVPRTGSKRSGVRKAIEIEGKRSNEAANSKESSSVLNIIKRVHDDIALGNSKDLRTLESELAKLEGISMSESNEQVKTFENLAKNKQRENQMTQVRTRVTKTRVREKEDPDEYYKYGATASGKLESWTLHFYGTGG